MDIRLSAIPGQDGPAVVLRLLDHGRSSVRLEDLGCSPSREKAIGELLRVPYGLILVTGPTGSGKTTTLYAIINALNSQHLKVVTVEDSIEVRLARVQQVTIHEAMGTTFGAVTRAFLRHDPDIVMIGEIRDPETAREAIRAALTGRKVLSTLHTRNSAGAIPRLLELGVEPGVIGGHRHVPCSPPARAAPRLAPRPPRPDCRAASDGPARALGRSARWAGTRPAGSADRRVAGAGVGR
jgi:type II secretory ATPase GspE/PulE/Tfp pilus assembly ATPase PilB-like protein